MKFFRKSNILKMILTAWIVLWIFFLWREMFNKGYIRDYRILLSRDTDGKRSYVTGDEFYAVIKLCEDRTPSDSTFRIEGVKEGSIDERRASYYLYPRILKPDRPDFVLVYRTSGFPREGYDEFAGIDKDRYILKRRDLKNWN